MTSDSVALAARSPLASVLDELATVVCHAADQLGRTPLLRVAGDVVPRVPFYRTLLRDLSTHADRPLHVELLASQVGLLQLYAVARIERYLRRALRDLEKFALAGVTEGRSIEIRRRAVLSRAAGPARPLVVGIALESEPVPAWARPLRLARQPLGPDDVRLVGRLPKAA